MRHLVPFRVYESQTTSGLSKKQEALLNFYSQGTWSVNPTTGLVDIRGNFEILKIIKIFPIKFGNVTGDFYCNSIQLQSLKGAPQKVGGCFGCSRNKLQSLAGAPQEVDGFFNCSHNELQSLEGAPQEVGGDFFCSSNELQSLVGAPKEINGMFLCDKFRLDKGEWNMDGWVKILQTGSEGAKKLILTLPYFDSNFWNSKISENPESTILQLSGFWDDLPDEFRNSIRIPSNLEEDFENLLELVRAGIM